MTLIYVFHIVPPICMQMIPLVMFLVIATEELSTKLNNDSNSIYKWCCENKMVINTDKTKSMLICSKQRLNTLLVNDNINVYIGGTQLESSKLEKLLGVRIDANLTWQDQVDHVCKMVGSRLGLLRRIKKYIDIPTIILYFNGYILPYIDYCNLICGTCSQGNNDRIEKLIKSAL